MLDLGQNFGDHLDAGAADADDGDFLAFKFDVLVVVGSMAELPLKSVEAFYVRPIPSAENRIYLC